MSFCRLRYPGWGLILLGLTACSGPDDQPQSPTPATSTPATSTPATPTPATPTPATPTPVTPTPATPLAGRVQGFVTALDGTPLQNVTLSVAGKVIATTSQTGTFSASELPIGRALEVEARRSGFSSSVREVLLLQDSVSTLRFVLQPSADAVLDFAEKGGKVQSADGLELEFPPNSVVDANGQAVSGPVQLRYTLLDQPSELPLAPGDFRATQQDGSNVQLESFGMAEVTLEQNGKPVTLSHAVTLRFPLFESPGTQASTLYAGRSIGLYRFDTDAGCWKEEGSGKVIYLNGKPTFEASVSHFSWWNSDVALQEKNCMTGRAVDADGNPLANLTVEAEGEDYSGGSSSVTDLNGLFCADVKRNSLNTLKLYGGTPEALYELTQSGIQVADIPTDCTLGGCLELGTITLTVTSDRDRDGYSVLAGDCDDDDALIHPKATEQCNGKDDNCDDRIDEGFTNRYTYYIDMDDDGYGNSLTTVQACAQPAHYASMAGDCDDTRAYIYPDARETCNGRDDNCDGTTDEAVTTAAWPDMDGDGYGDSTGEPVQACGIPSGYSNNYLDCDDANANSHPGALEQCDGRDNNCNGDVDEDSTQTLYPDLDQDGYGDSKAAPQSGCADSAFTSLNALDCNDQDVKVSPEGTEVSDGIDNNCNGLVDELDAVLYTDLDGDGYGTGIGDSMPVNTPGYSTLSGDCNDTNADISPYALEVCDSVDNDCDGSIDDGAPLLLLYRDADGDGYGDASQTLLSCEQRSGYVVNGLDCNDRNATQHPHQPEVCNGLDEDCDGLMDEGVEETERFYQDKDGDGYGDPNLPVDGCVAPEGTVSNDRDCNDNHAEVYPGAPELCDAFDNDCDGVVNEGTQALYYPDDDGDGYGDAQAVPSCDAGPTLVTRGGDCNDANPAIYPAAPDTAGDGVDSSCDGMDGQVPSVGLATSSFSTIQGAMDAAQDGQTVWVGPGTYFEAELSMKGKALRLASTDGETATIIDGQQLGSVFSFDFGEQPDSVLEGFTLTGGKASPHTFSGGSQPIRSGGGIFMDAAAPTLKRLRVVDCSSESYGGGIFIGGESSPVLQQLSIEDNVSESGGGLCFYSSSPQLSEVAVVGNRSSYQGGGMFFWHSPATLTELRMEDNYAFASGGGAYLFGADATFSQLQVLHNEVSLNSYSGNGGGMDIENSAPTMVDAHIEGNFSFAGGGIYLYQSEPTLTRVTLEANTAETGGGLCAYSSTLELEDGRCLKNVATYSGGGFFLSSTHGRLRKLQVEGNIASKSGGGIYLNDFDPYFEQVTIAGNSARESGGGLYIDTSEPVFKQASIVDNSSRYGGGLYANFSSFSISNSILAYNTGMNLLAESDSRVTMTSTNLYQKQGISHNLESLASTVTELEPAFVRFSYDGNPFNDDLHLRLTSPLIDAGDPSTCNRQVRVGCDPDGSIADLGVYGGPGADFSYYDDSDADTLYDGWETSQVGNTTELDASTDRDGDGLSDAAELEVATDPLLADSDQDGASDQAEVAAGSNPLNPFWVPGIAGLIPLQVPSAAYPTLQDALDAIPNGEEGIVRVDAGTYAEPLLLSRKSVTVEGAGEGLTVVDGQAKGPVWAVSGATLYLSGMTLQNGKAELGGGIDEVSSDGLLERLTIRANVATGGVANAGGGIYLGYASPDVTDVVITGNQATQGGGLYLFRSSPTLTAVAVKANSASNQGGGIYVGKSNPHLSQLSIEQNTASRGGGLYLSDANPILEDVRIEGNTGGAYLFMSEATFSRVDVVGNSEGGMYLSHADATFERVNILRNTSNNGGAGLYLDFSNPVLHLVTLADNVSQGSGGGLYLYYATPVVRQLVVSGNAAHGNGGGIYVYDSNPTLDQVSLVGNTAKGIGGGIYSYHNTPILTNSILADNAGLNLYAEMGEIELRYTNLFQQYGTSHGLTSLPATVTELDPQFVAFSQDGDFSNDDLHLRPGSPLIDAGDPSHCTTTDRSGCDPDGSLPDLGAYGGADADFSYYADSDVDGLYDGWEQEMASDLTTLSADADADHEGLTDAQELGVGSNPLTADSDGDGASDSAEVTADSDPLSPISLPGGLVALEVPSAAYPTIQAALDAVPAGTEGYIKVGAGTFHENLTLFQKEVTLEGAGEGQTYIDGGNMGSVLTVDSAHLNLTGVTAQQGDAKTGGGLSMRYATGDWELVTLQNNIAYGIDQNEGGAGAYLYYSGGEFNKVSVLHNSSAPGLTYFKGGGLYLNHANLTFTQCRIEGNAAYFGGGIYVEGSSPMLRETTFKQNSATQGGAVFVMGGAPVLTQLQVEANSASERGGGLYFQYSRTTLTDSLVQGNQVTGATADDGGGGIYLNSDHSTLAQVRLVQNATTASGNHSGGGGLYALQADASLHQLSFEGNSTDSFGGGVYLYGSALTVSRTRFEGNSASAGGGLALAESNPRLDYVSFVENTARQYGGALSAVLSSPVLNYARFEGNVAPAGAALALSDSTPSMSWSSVTGNEASGGGAISLYTSTVTMDNTVLAYNKGGNLYRGDNSTVSTQFSALYNPSGFGSDNLTVTGSPVTAEPKFLAYADKNTGASCTPGTSTLCVPSDLHLALTSPLINAGDSAQKDVDGSRADIGSYGGQGGDEWDADWDGVPDYFWPGSWSNAPAGFTAGDYDCDDLDPTVQSCL